MAIEFLSARVSQLSAHMSENGLQPPPMPPENGIALQKVLTSLGLSDIFRDISGNVAGSSRITGRSGPAIQPPVNGDEGTQESLPGLITAVSGAAANESISQEDSFNLDVFGNDLQLWNSHAETEVSCSTSGPKGPSPHDLDTSPFGDVLSACAEAMPDGRSRVDYEGPSIFDEGDATLSNGSNESLVDELSHRVGTLTIGPEGRTKLHGASLMFDVEKAKHSNFPPVHSEFLASSDFSSTEQRIGSDVPEELQEHLVNQYFHCENPFSDVVDREIYTVAKARCRNGEATPYFSHALCNAM